MIGATQRWLKRNRNFIAVGAGVVGVGYLAGQYVIGKVNEARQRMSDDRIAKEKYYHQSIFILATIRITILIIYLIVCAGVSSRTKTIAPSPFSLYSRLPPTMF